MAIRGTHAERPSRLAMARSRGAVTGPLLMILGAWGAVIPFIGHAFGYGFTPDNTWTWTAARGWLEVLPGSATFVGGFLLTTSANRISAMIGGWLAAAAGAWFVLGTVISPWWSAGNIGTPTGSTDLAVWERLGMFSGLGVLIVFLAATALGRASVIGIRDVEVATARNVDVTDETQATRRSRVGSPATAAPAPATATDTRETAGTTRRTTTTT